MIDEQVVKDVVLTINQAMEPVEKGVTMIQETIHQISAGSEEKQEETEVKVEENVEYPSGSASHVLRLEEKVVTEDDLEIMR